MSITCATPGSVYPRGIGWLTISARLIRISKKVRAIFAAHKSKLNTVIGQDLVVALSLTVLCISPVSVCLFCTDYVLPEATGDFFSSAHLLANTYLYCRKAAGSKVLLFLHHQIKREGNPLLFSLVPSHMRQLIGCFYLSVSHCL